MRRAARRGVVAIAVGLGVALGGPNEAAVADAGGYPELVRLFDEWRAFQRPRVTDGVPDYTAAAMERQRRELPKFQARLTALDPKGWPVSQQVDWHIVRAEMNGLDFDHRVLRPWSRNPCFYRVLHEEQSDTPAHEGHAQASALELWTYSFPVQPDKLDAFRTSLRAVPGILQQAKVNLVEDARDLWMLGARVKRSESAILERLTQTLATHHPALVADARRAKEAVDEFGAWVERKSRGMSRGSGVGIENYDWYLKNVHLSPYSWAEERALHERELSRSLAHLALQQQLDNRLPALTPIASAAEYKKRFRDDVAEYMKFLADRRIVTVKAYMEPALLEREGPFQAAEDRDFFAQVEFRAPVVMRCHGYHWFDLARMAREPHPSPIRRGPLLYNIWDSRAEGFATANEEMMMTAGLLDKNPRAKELVYVLVANRAARGLAGLEQHSGELNFDQARRFAHEHTPFGWLKEAGDTNWNEQQLYLEQPGYGSCYLAGKAQIERLLAERAQQLGDRFLLQQFMDELNGAGMIPVSLIRWETTGRDDEIRRLGR